MSMVSALSFADDDHGMWGRARAALPSHDQYARADDIARPVARQFISQSTQSRRVALAGNPANDSVCEIFDRSQHVTSPSERQQHDVERDVPQLDQNPQVLKDRIRNAMKRRVGPNTGLTVKMVARATGLTERTIENASSGTMPRGDTLMALVDFFDATFANEVFAGGTFLVVKLSDHRAAAAARQINDGLRVLAELQRGR